MPWLAIPHGDARIQELMEKFEITGIPALVLLKKDGSLASKNGRNDVQQQGPEIWETWETLVEN